MLDRAIAAGLLERARAAAAFAYAPFSRFPVGAAVLAADGRVFTGANVENSSYGLTVCAERVAVFKAVSEGVRSLRAVAVSCTEAAGCTPCGACRQVLFEFGPEMTMVVDATEGPSLYLLTDLLPHGFRLAHP